MVGLEVFVWTRCAAHFQFLVGLGCFLLEQVRDLGFLALPPHARLFAILRCRRLPLLRVTVQFLGCKKAAAVLVEAVVVLHTGWPIFVWFLMAPVMAVEWGCIVVSTMKDRRPSAPWAPSS